LNDRKMYYYADVTALIATSPRSTWNEYSRQASFIRDGA